MTLLFMLSSLLSYNILCITVGTIFKAHTLLSGQNSIFTCKLDNMKGPADNAFRQHMMLQSIHFFLNMFKKNAFFNGTVSVAVYGYRTHWFRRRIRLYNQNEAYNSVAVYGYGTNSPWNGSVAVQNRPLSMYKSSQAFICASAKNAFFFKHILKKVYTL